MKMFILFMGLMLSVTISRASFRSLFSIFPSASERSSSYSIDGDGSVKDDAAIMIEMVSGSVSGANLYEDLFVCELLRLAKGRQRNKLLYYFGAAVRDDTPFADPHFRRLLAVKAFCAACAKMPATSTNIADLISLDYMERIAPGPVFGEKPLSSEDLPSFKAGFALALLVWYRTYVDPDFPISLGAKDRDDSETEELPGYGEEGGSLI